MKTNFLLRVLVAAAAVCLATGCASQSKKSASAPPQPPVPLSENADAAESPQASEQSTLTAEEEALFEDDSDEWDDGEEEQQVALIADPIEPFNRAMFYFNDKLYVYVFKPITLGYRTVTPEKARVGVSNFFTNLTTPIRFANCLLQGKGRAATAELSKFIFNSTFGVLGFGDLFKDYPEMYPDSEDFGQTLGTYGIGDGFYIVWPFFGASTLRDSVGMAGDAVLNPVTYIDSNEAALAVRGVDMVNKLSFRIEDIDAAKKASFDYYEAGRNFYIQLRRSKLSK